MFIPKKGNKKRFTKKRRGKKKYGKRRVKVNKGYKNSRGGIRL